MIQQVHSFSIIIIMFFEGKKLAWRLMDFLLQPLATSTKHQQAARDSWELACFFIPNSLSLMSSHLLPCASGYRMGDDGRNPSFYLDALPEGSSHIMKLASELYNILSKPLCQEQLLFLNNLKNIQGTNVVSSIVESGWIDPPIPWLTCDKWSSAALLPAGW